MKYTKYYLGCDPDTKKTGIGILNENGVPVFVGNISGSGS